VTRRAIAEGECGPGDRLPSGSMPLWAAALFPALIWAVLVVVIAVALRRAGVGVGGAIPGWAAASLGFGGVTLVGGQASVVRANRYVSPA